MRYVRILCLAALLVGCEAPTSKRGRFIEPRAAFVGQPLLVEEIPGSRRWRLQRPLGYETDSGLLIQAEAGFETDFASTPWWIWWLWPPWDPRYGRPSVIHDKNYREHGRVNANVRLTRKQSDRVFRDAMRDVGAGYFTRSTIYNAVRVGNPEWPEDRGK